MNINPQPEPIYQVAPQQLPPTYAMSFQITPRSAPTQQQPQPVYNNQNLSTMYPTGPGTLPPSKNEWPRKPVGLVCPRCGATVETRVKAEMTPVTWMCVLLFLCCTFCLFWIPLCVPVFKKTTHYCPYCNSALGVRKAL
ncbi:unnamed protein product [Rotaria sordida]|uniref:LITAF domain-containing protein n=1 Tax=Rotaria sordida TaxID=392033 RepID=A0A815RRN6_9BILA|nr:unnamed protein product [Rotaria sordida]CAF1552402.1 unnamed protein product [Rotaria sordida]CAF1552449.1 unnamed protein product [Rotaria sordida]CAF1673804.1 unnamed protein product [Rotaria sordida]CAF1673826.1 unnamed protein product [Rotaria sordida]